MCGILAVWDPYVEFKNVLKNAVLDLKHRGPDSQKSINLKDNKLFLAHTFF